MMPRILAGFSRTNAAAQMAAQTAAQTKGTTVMDSHKLNMYAGGLIGSLLLFLLLGFFSDLIFVGRGHDNEPLAFAVEIEEAEAGGGEEMAVDWSALVAAADAAKGEKLFGKCKACHKVEDGANGVGPHLFNVVGRDIGSVGGYAFSETLAGMDGSWDLEALSGFLESPKGYAPGTKMGFGGLKKVEDRVNLIVYLNEAGDAPVELASAAPAETATDATTETAAEAEPAAETETATETAAATTEEAAEPAAGDLASLLASADAEAGKKVFRKCRACHSPDEGKNGIGPSLWGIVGRDIASIDGFGYSDAMAGQEGNWTGSRLFEFLENPRDVVSGTKMTFPGVKDAQDRANVITFLNENDGSPEPLE
jgi:cytochrome c2